MKSIADELKRIKKAVSEIKKEQSDRDADLTATDEILEAVASIEQFYKL